MPRLNRLDWLETFVAVYDHASFTAAARALHRSQSRVSAHIAELEQTLGQELIDRTMRPLELTDAGQLFLPHARSLLASADAAYEDIDRLSHEARGRVVVGTHPSISSGWMPQVFAQAARRHPQLTVTLVERTTTSLVDMLREGSIDLAILANAADIDKQPSPLQGTPLWYECYAAIVPANDPLAQAGANPADLACRPLIAISSTAGAIDPEFTRWASHFHVELPPVAWSTEQPQTVVNLVRAGLGIGIINRLAVDTCTCDGLAVLFTTTPPHMRTVSLWRDARRHMPAATRALANILLTAEPPSGCTTLRMHGRTITADN